MQKAVCLLAVRAQPARCTIFWRRRCCSACFLRYTRHIYLDQPCITFSHTCLAADLHVDLIPRSLVFLLVNVLLVYWLVLCAPPDLWWQLTISEYAGAATADVARPVGDVAISFPGQANDKEAVTAPKPGEAKGLPKGPTAKPPSGPSLPKVGVQVCCLATHRMKFVPVRC